MSTLRKKSLAVASANLHDRIARRKAKAGKAAAKRAPRAPKPEGGESKKDAIIRLASRPKGATLDELMTETGWQRHSVRGAIATIGHEHKIVSTKTESGQRHYQIE